MSRADIVISYLSLKCSTLEEELFYKKAECEQLLTEIEEANKKKESYKDIALELGISLRQIAAYAQIETQPKEKPARRTTD
jgi:uncharacterized protein YdbL (DUF1318 family)